MYCTVLRSKIYQYTIHIQSQCQSIIEGMPGPARLYQFNPMSPIHHDEIFWSWVLDGTNKQKTGSNIVTRSFCLPTRSIARSEDYGLGPVCLDPNFVRFRVNLWLWFSTCDRKQWCQARTIAQRRKAAFTLLARCFLLDEGHHPLIWRSFWCSPWVCLCPRVYIMICSTKLSGEFCKSPSHLFASKGWKNDSRFPCSEGEWYMYEE